MSSSNFHYGQRLLENELVAVDPFNPSIHLSQTAELIRTSPEIFTYLEFPTIENEEDFIQKVWLSISTSSADCLFAICDRSSSTESQREVKVAGLISLNGTNPEKASTEIGILVFPEFHRTHVATNAIGLLLQWTLDPPSAGGLGLRRVEWKTHADNVPSRRIALRLGFELEGICRWERALSHGKTGLSVTELEKRNKTIGERPGRHTAIYSIVWDEWESKRPVVAKQMGLRLNDRNPQLKQLDDEEITHEGIKRF